MWHWILKLTYCSSHPSPSLYNKHVKLKAKTGQINKVWGPQAPSLTCLLYNISMAAYTFSNIFNKSRKFNDKNILQSKKSHENHNVKKSLWSEVLHWNVHFEKPSFTCRQLTIKCVKRDNATNAFSWEIC